MTKNNEDILNKIYSGTKKGELIKKEETAGRVLLVQVRKSHS